MQSSLSVSVVGSTFGALGSRSVFPAAVLGRSVRCFDVPHSFGFGAGSSRCGASGPALGIRMLGALPAVSRASFGFGSAQRSALGCRPRRAFGSRPSWSAAAGVLPAFPGHRLAAPFQAVRANPAVKWDAPPASFGSVPRLIAPPSPLHPLAARPLPPLHGLPRKSRG